MKNLLELDVLGKAILRILAGFWTKLSLGKCEMKKCELGISLILGALWPSLCIVEIIEIIVPLHLYPAVPLRLSVPGERLAYIPQPGLRSFLDFDFCSLLNARSLSEGFLHEKSGLWPWEHTILREMGSWSPLFFSLDNGNG